MVARKPAATAAKPAARTTAAKPAASRAASAAKPAARAAAKPAATTKAAPARASRASKAVVEDDEPDLLAEMDDETTTVDDDDDDFDLLSDLTEDGGVAWMPWDEEDQPDGIQGRVLAVSTVEADQKFGGGEVPYVEIEGKDGTQWAVRGYATVLKNQLEREIDKGLTHGDTIAIKYFGEKENRRGDNSYKNFKVMVRRAK